jgi:hypothetical protein
MGNEKKGLEVEKPECETMDFGSGFGVLWVWGSFGTLYFALGTCGFWP